MHDEDAAEVAKALGHPIRIEILKELQSQRDISASDFARRSGHPLGNASYHVRVLVGAGILESTEEVPRRGAMEHRYSLNRPDSKAALAVLDLLVAF